jgi:hypothetical protein
MSGFVFDANAARAAIAARRTERGDTAVPAVYETATPREPQEPQQPQIGSFSSSSAGAIATAGTATTASFRGPTLDEIDAIEERAALAAESVPACYLDAWAHFQCQRPLSLAESEWWQAIDDAGLFLDAWGANAAAMQWSSDELFDVPREGRPGGLVWQLKGCRVSALGTDKARVADGRTIMRHLRGDDM